MFFSPKTHGKMILMLEVQSSLVRSSLIWYCQGQPAAIIFTDEKPVPFKPDVGTPYFIKTALKALSLAIDSALRALHTMSREDPEKGMPRRAEEVHYVLSSPWIASQARTLTLSFDKNTAVTREKIAEILEGERKKLVPEAGGPLETIEEKIFDVRLNGYSISGWEGKQTRQLEVSYAVTVGGADTTRHFRDAVEHVVSAKKVRFHSSMLLQYVGIRTAMPDRTAYALIHIHGELTDVLAVKNGSCIFFGSFPMGIGTIVRKIAYSCKTDAQTADSLLSLYLGNKLEGDYAKNVEALLSGLSAGWIGELKKVFQDASLEAFLSRSAIITARAHDDFFAKSFSQAYPAAEIETWAASDIMPGAEFAPTVHRQRGISVYAVAVGSFYDKM